MTNLYQEVSTNYSGSEDNLLGPNYTNYKIIKTPSDMEVGVRGSFTNDINDLIQYVESLLSGKSNTSSTDRHLENKFESFSLLDSFWPSSKPHHKISVETVLSDNEQSSETHYAPLIDIDPFGIEKFQNYNEDFLPDDPLAQVYLASLGILGLFILYRLMEKEK